MPVPILASKLYIPPPLFLPFVDNDPKTAEVLSKILLLARDSEIRDPILLEQVIAVG